MKISQKLVIILLLIGLLPAIGISVIAYATVYTQADETTTAQLQSTAIRQEQRVNVLLRERLEEVSKLANQLNLQRALRDYFETDSSQARDELTDILFAKRATFPDIQQVYLSNLEGRVIAATLADVVGEMSGEKPGMSVQRDSRDDVNKLHVSISVAIDRQAEAVVTVVFRIDDLTAAIQDYTGLGRTGETMLVSRSDPAALSLFPLRDEPNGALQQSLESLDIQNHPRGEYEATSYTGEDVVMVVRPLSTADWLLAVSIDASEAYAVPAQLRTALMWVMTGTSIVIVLIALAMTRSITVPILRIVRTSQAIGEGDLTAKSDVVRSDEIGVLSDSINKMGASLRGYVDRVREQRNRLEVVLNSATESIMAIDSKGVIVMANKATATLSDRPADDIMTHAITDIFVWKKGGHRAAVDYYPSEVRVYSDLEYTTDSGELRYVKLIVSPVKSAPSQEVRSIVTVHDETKSRELENMKIDFVSMAAHELRTPLAALRGYLELAMYQTPEAKEETDQLVGKALKSTAELTGLINNLLDVSRIERGALTLNFGKVDIAHSVKDAIESSRVIANDKQISLKYTGPAQGNDVYADEVAVREVLNNLLSNAIKYTNAGGTVTVGIKRQDDAYAVSITDTGIGIPKRALPNLFTKFYRVHGGLDSGSTGTGLGLYITRSILDRHDGKITVESQEGVGSTFTFTLPVYVSQGNENSNGTTGKTNESRRHRGWFTKNIDR